MGDSDVRTPIAKGATPRKPSAAVAKMMERHKRPRGPQDDQASPRLPRTKLPAAAVGNDDDSPQEEGDSDAVVWRGPRALAVSPSIIAWLSPANEFLVLAPVFTYAMGPVIEVCEDNRSVRVTWTWAPLSTVVESLCREQCAFAALQHWGVAAGRDSSPEFTETRVVPVPDARVRIRDRKNIVKRSMAAEDNCVVAIYSTNLSEPDWHDRVAPPRIMRARDPAEPAEAHNEVKPASKFLADTD